MSFDGWRTALVLGGIRSGKSEFAESLVADVPTVRYVATATVDPTDEEWAARIAEHRARRAPTWTTEEVGGSPDRLPGLVADAKPNEVLFIDDLGGWVAALLRAPGVSEASPAAASEGLALPNGEALPATVEAFAGALRACAARVVVVSPEVGLTPVPTTQPGRVFADELGTANHAVADACDLVALVVAGQPVWLKRSRHTIPAPPRRQPGPGAQTDIRPGLDLPLPDELIRTEARTRYLALGALGDVVGFAAATQGTATPRQWDNVRVLLLHGDHAGDGAAGDSPEASARRAAEGPLALLAAQAEASLQVVPAPASGAIETTDALTADEADEAMRYGWQLADEAVDSGADLLVIGACGAGTDTAAAAVIATTTSAEPATLLGRVVAADGRIDDDAWMRRCAALRDALQRTRLRARSGSELLVTLGGGDIAIATGILLGATARRTPVLLDGPVGVAAALVSRDFAGQVRHWCLLPDHGGHPGVRQAADILDLRPVVDLRLGTVLGEGATALAVLPVLRNALALATAGE
jgi:adenosyl cobinamide kinase/adenosyl cobinamide phosphate guanylyltransferase/NaMN:DMB phosphoribosyltransferase